MKRKQIFDSILREIKSTEAERKASVAEAKKRQSAFEADFNRRRSSVQKRIDQFHCDFGTKK